MIYIYPMTGRPDVPLPDGWDGIPGARGCTPQSCSFRDHYAELKALDTRVFGLSAQTSKYQREARERLQLPFPVAGMVLFKRLTLITKDGRIEKVFYPVFPPEQNADEVLVWLRKNVQSGAAGDAP